MWRYTGKPRVDYDRIALQRDGVTLRAFVPEDASRVREIVQDPDIVRFSHLPSHWRTEDGALEYLGSLPRLASSGQRIDLAIEALRPGWLIGHAALRGISWRRKCAEVATWVAPEARGNGIGAKALELISDWGFSELRLLRMLADPDRENLPSQRMLEQAGFAAERTERLDDGRTVVIYERSRASSNGR